MCGHFVILRPTPLTSCSTIPEPKRGEHVSKHYSFFGCGFGLCQLLLQALYGLQALLQLSLGLGRLRFSFPLHILSIFQLPVTTSPYFLAHMAKSGASCLLIKQQCKLSASPSI